MTTKHTTAHIQLANRLSQASDLTKKLLIRLRAVTKIVILRLPYLLP
jgi:hypothetical protein